MSIILRDLGAGQPLASTAQCYPTPTMPEADPHADLLFYSVGKPPFAGNVTHIADQQYGNTDTYKIGHHKPDIFASDQGRLIIGEAMTTDDLGTESFHEKLADFSTYRIDNERVAFFLIVPDGLAQAASRAIGEHGERHYKTGVITID